MLIGEEETFSKIVVKDYVSYIMENINQLINCFNKREMKAHEMNFC